MIAHHHFHNLNDEKARRICPKKARVLPINYCLIIITADSEIMAA